MRKKQLPLKIRVMEWAINYGKPFDAQDVYDGIAEEYKGERFCNIKHIDRLIGAYCGNMMMDMAEYEPESGQEDVIKYMVTEVGKKTQVYIDAQK